MNTRQQTQPSICLTQYKDVCVQLSMAVCSVSEGEKKVETVQIHPQGTSGLWSSIDVTLIGLTSSTFFVTQISELTML